MEFIDIREWIMYVSKLPIDELSVIINSDFDLHEKINSFEKKEVDSQILVEIYKKLYKTEIEVVFWEEVLFWIIEKCIPHTIINDFIKRKILLSVLGHLNLDDEFLLELSKNVEEALFTLGKRYYTEHFYTGKKLEQFLNDFKNNYFLLNKLSKENSTDEKEKILADCILEKTDFKDLKERITQLNTANIIRETCDINTILQYSESKNPIYIKAIAQNKLTPKEILQKIMTIKQLNGAKKIRIIAQENLKKRNNSMERNE